MNKKAPYYSFLRGICTLLAIAGLFCVLVGCDLAFRDATEPPILPETDGKGETDVSETNSTETAIPAETQKAPETETEAPETVVNFENLPSEEAKKWIALYESKGDPAKILLNEAEIAALNEKIRESCPTMHNMGEIPDTINGGDIAKWISQGKAPAAGVLDSFGSTVTTEQLSTIEANKNLSAIPEAVTPQTAVVVKRTNIRTVPTEIQLFNQADTNRHFDRIQEAELIIGTPVLVLHESLDGAFQYIQSYYYRGWVRAADLAQASAEDYRSFLPKNPTPAVTVTADATVLDSGVTLDMGVRLPYSSSADDSFTVALPCRDDNGMLRTELVTVSKADAYYGVLPYTMENFITQAFKFLGRDYSWGGYNESVDCSGFVCAVFRSFGLYLPRNTGEQKEYGGVVTPLAGLEKDRVTEVLDSLTYPTAIHRPGHVMLLLGVANGKIHVIHAPTGGQKVSVMELWQTDNLISAVTVEWE